MNENATVDICLFHNDTCPDGYYFEWFGPQIHEDSSLKSLSGKAICRKCHPRCKKCTGYGFHELICQECTNFKKGEQCEDECTLDHYPDIATHVCIQCDPECRGCTGPGPENCVICQNFRLYDDAWIDPNNTFRSVKSLKFQRYTHKGILGVYLSVRLSFPTEYSRKVPNHTVPIKWKVFLSWQPKALPTL